jgi:hypothetical protein
MAFGRPFSEEKRGFECIICRLCRACGRPAEAPPNDPQDDQALSGARRTLPGDESKGFFPTIHVFAAPH